MPDNKRSLAFVMVVAFFVSLILLSTITSKGISPGAYGQQGGGLQQLTIGQEVIDLPYREMIHSVLVVPPNAQDPKVLGAYDVRGADNPAVGIYIVDSSECSLSMLSENPSICNPMYMAINTRQAPSDSGIVVPLNPGKTYYLVFSNEATAMDILNAHYNYLVRKHFILQYNLN